MKRLLVAIMLLMTVSSALAAGLGLAVYFWAARDLPNFKRIADYRPPLATTVYTRDGQILGYLYHEKRFLARLEDMPPHLPRAFLAAEDKSFYEHEGIDLKAIVRAFIKNLKAGSTVQGGSTITQQIIKRMLLTSEKRYERKIKEAILAYRLENYLTKDEILTIYLNEIYLGSRAYGVEAAARVYFGKHVGELTLAESAIMAGLPQAPSRHDPYDYPENAKTRQKYVLGRMLELNWITQAEHDEAVSQPLLYKSMEDPSWKQGAYYLDEVRRWLVSFFSDENLKKRKIPFDRFGEDAIYEGGLHVMTGLDMRHQLAAEHALREGLEASTKRAGWRGPIATLKPEEFNAFLTRDAAPIESTAPGEWLKVLVVDVKKDGATVRNGNREGFMPVKSMGWCRAPNPKLAPENVAHISDARAILRPGDVVWASLESSPFAPPPAAPEPAPAPGAPSAPASPDKDPRKKPQVKGPPPLTFALQQRPIVQGAIISLEPPSGEVRALVGGYAYEVSQFNRATQAYRQPGSTFKPIVYSAAMDAGFTPASIVVDAPITIKFGDKIWRPENYSEKFYGPTTLRTALAKSRNLVTIRVTQRMGVKRVIERAKALGLEPEFPPYLPICLGAVAVTPMNLCQAYTAFARDGSTIKPRLALTVKGPWGEMLYASQPETHQAISPQNAYVMSWMLKEVVNNGTAVRVKALGRPVAGKTGTTNEERDAWFMGFTPYLLSGVYMGFDHSTPMGKYETGSRAALPVWLNYRQKVESNYPPQDFQQPPGIYFARVGSQDRDEDGNLMSSAFFMPFIAATTTSAEAESTEPVGAGADETITDDATGASSQGEELFKQIFQ
jgi:penicillin-binding protein 1A